MHNAEMNTIREKVIDLQQTNQQMMMMMLSQRTKTDKSSADVDRIELLQQQLILITQQAEDHRKALADLREIITERYEQSPQPDIEKESDK